MVLCAARMFVLGASALEQMALAQHPEEWAQQMNTEKQPAAAAGAFKKKPTAKRYRALLEAAAASLLSEQSLTRKRKKPKLEDSSAADSEDEEATDKEDSSEESGQQHDSISSDEKKKKKKKQKTKEHDRKKVDKKQRGKQKGKDKAKPANAEVLVDSPEPEDPDEEQTQVLSTWQLSEIQSAEGEWQLFKEALKSAAATQEDFAKHLNHVPVKVREAFGVKVKKLPAKAEARHVVAQRMQDIIAAGKSFWAAQQGQPLPQE